MNRSPRVLIIVENLHVPFDRRVWQEATTLRDAGYTVSVVCPVGKGAESRYEELDGIAIYRHPLPLEASGALGYLLEYATALYWELRLSLRARRERGVDLIHACNPPDLIFLVGLVHKALFGTRFLFDHHDINPELYVAKFGRKDLFYRLMLLFERLTFAAADLSIATNESYKKIAVERGGMRPERVHVVRSGPDLRRVRVVPPHPRWKNGRPFLAGYLGTMGKQEGVDYLLEGVAYLVHTLGRNDVQFVVIGGGTELEALRRLAVDKQVHDYVTFTGRVPDDVLLEALSTADVCVNPDVVNDMNDKSTMNKVMEYMALGKPIVQFEMTEARVSAREASLYAAPNDPRSLIDNVLVLLADPERRARMGELGRQRVVNELQWKFEAPKLLAAYADVLPRPAQ